ncbi:MAG: phosphatidylserine decarboxylase family protein [Planctomycetaceae bacterium]|nr:phosphatidylserine decarboxylase family protein [Planctomycetaceae bacterium]
MDPQITSIQPGGGVVVRLELAWGSLRRAYLKRFRPGYVARMAALRRGSKNACPFEVLDPRDVKFFRNQEGYWWEPHDDSFAWRNRLPFARVGLTELWLISGLFFGVAGGLAWLAARVSPWLWAAAAVPAFLGGCIVWFFRNPRRPIPQEAGVVVSPADGKIVHIEELAHDEFVGGPAVLIGIFLSVFNVHINRTPVAARVIGLRYRKGKFLNALRPESARENEQLAVRMEENAPPYRRMIVRQITGAIARRIVCWVKPGDELAAGEQFGMIKLGSRTELVFPREPGLTIAVRMGEHVKAGSSVLAKYEITDRTAVGLG